MKPRRGPTQILLDTEPLKLQSAKCPPTPATQMDAGTPARGRFTVPAGSPGLGILGRLRFGLPIWEMGTQVRLPGHLRAAREPTGKERSSFPHGLPEGQPE